MKKTRDECRRKIMDTIEIDQNGCWLWTGSLNADGYAHVGWKTWGTNSAHRLSYIAFTGKDIIGQLDHRCRVRRCVNPDHLEDVTHRVNMIRAPHIAAQVARTHCPHGHEYSPENTYVSPSDNRRHCRTCGRRHAQDWATRSKIVRSHPS